MNYLDVGILVLFVLTPTLIGAVLVSAPRWCGWITRAWERRRPAEPVPGGPPIERLAADLRRLLRLHQEMTVSAHLAMRAHRLWAVEAAIGVRALEAARALDVPYVRAPGELTCRQLGGLLEELSAAGLVLPARVGPFTSNGCL